MSGGYRVVVTGDREVMAAFRKLGLKAGDLSNVNQRIADEAAADARAFAPKRTGALAGSVAPGRSRTKAYITAGTGSVPYAAPINYGWPARGIAATEFMQRAADTKADSAAEAIAAEIQRLVDAAGLG